MDTSIRTLRLETSKRGRSNAPGRPSLAGSSQTDFDVPIPKELGLPSLKGECQIVRIGKRSPKWQWLKEKEGKSLLKWNKGRSEDRSENLRLKKTKNKTAFLASPIYIGQAQGEEKKTYKEEPKLGQGVLFSSSLLGWPTLMP